MNKITGVVGVVLIGLGLFGYSEYVLVPKRHDLDGVYNQNDLDIMFFGSSHCHNTFDPLVFNNGLNANSYLYTSPGQPLWMTYYFMKEGFRLHKPKLAIVEVIGATYAKEDKLQDLAAARNAFDHMRLGINKVNMIRTSGYNYDFGTFFNLFSYHDQWKHLKKSNFFFVSDAYRGFYPSFERYKPGTPSSTKDKKISGLVKIELLKIQELCNEEGIDLLCVYAPFSYEKSQKHAILNGLSTFMDDHKIEFLNFMSSDVLNDTKVDFHVDLRDSGHLNYWGAQKVSAYMVRYLQGRYNFLSDGFSPKELQRWDSLKLRSEKF